MVFHDREDAGRQTCGTPGRICRRPEPVVLGIPRGGVVVAYEVARALGAPLDVFLATKLPVPGQEELAFGAMAESGECFLDAGHHPTPPHPRCDQVEQISAAAAQRLHQRAELYRAGRPALAFEGKTVILVDDGIATGASIHVSILALRAMHPSAAGRGRAGGAGFDLRPPQAPRGRTGLRLRARGFRRGEPVLSATSRSPPMRRLPNCCSAPEKPPRNGADSSCRHHSGNPRRYTRPRAIFEAGESHEPCSSVAIKGSNRTRSLVWEDEAPAESRFRRVQQSVPLSGRGLPGMPLEMEDPDGDERPRFGKARRDAVRRPWWRPAGTWGRVALGLGALIVVSGLAIAVHISKTFLERDARFRITGSSNIQASGLAEVTRAEMLPVFGEDIGRNIFFVPIALRRKQLEQIPWVQQATVMRILPDQIRVSLVERQPVAFVRHDAADRPGGCERRVARHARLDDGAASLFVSGGHRH